MKPQRSTIDPADPPLRRPRSWRRVLPLAALLVLAACKGSHDASAPMAAPAYDEESVASSADEAVAGAPAPDAAATGRVVEAPAVPIAASGGGGPAANIYIIKEASMGIQVDRLETGLGRLETVAAQGGGYVTAKQTEFADIYNRRANLTLVVKVDQFEATLERIRKLALAVTSESSSGVDVSQQVVDAEAEIANLEATRARIRGFLDKAEDVEEALQVNAQLTQIEGELAIKRGRLKDLGQRSSFSTIQVSLTEPQPQISPTPWPSATPAPTATPGPPWNPGEQAGQAFKALRVLLQALGSLAIWLTILGLPFLGLLWLLRRGWALLGLPRFRVRSNRPTRPAGDDDAS